MSFTVICLNCGISFEANRSTAKFHNDICRVQYARKKEEKKEEQIKKFEGKAKIIESPKEVKITPKEIKKEYGSYLEGGYKPFVNGGAYRGNKSLYRPYPSVYGAGRPPND